MKDKTFITLSSLFFILFVGGVVALSLEKPTIGFLTNASNANPSPHKSFAVVFPQVGVSSSGAKEGTKIKVSVYIRDINGTALQNRSVRLSSNTSSIITTPAETQSTNSIGQAQFFITSTDTGKVELQVTDTTSNTTIINVPSVEFTE